jgi:hypothetical protein
MFVFFTPILIMLFAWREDMSTHILTKPTFFRLPGALDGENIFQGSLVKRGSEEKYYRGYSQKYHYQVKATFL